MGIRRFAKTVSQTLLRIEQRIFKTEVEKRVAVHEAEAKVLSNIPEDEDKIESQKKKIKKKLDKKTRTQEDIEFKYRTNTIISLADAIKTISSYEVYFGPIKVIQSLLYLLGYSMEDVADAKNRAVWKKIRSILEDDFTS